MRGASEDAKWGGGDWLGVTQVLAACFTVYCHSGCRQGGAGRWAVEAVSEWVREGERERERV